MPKRIGPRLRKLRETRGYSQRGLAAALNIDYSHISKIENGKSLTSIDFLEKIAEFFNIDISYFFVEEEMLAHFEKAEEDILFERELTPEALMDKYNLNVNGKIATREEIEEAIRYIEALRVIAQNKKNTQ